MGSGPDIGCNSLHIYFLVMVKYSYPSSFIYAFIIFFFFFVIAEEDTSDGLVIV